MFFPTFWTNKKYFIIWVFQLIIHRIHYSFTGWRSISWDFSIYMQRCKTIRTMIPACFSRWRNFLSTIDTYKWFIYFFHNWISQSKKEPSSRNRIDLSPKVVKVGSSYQSRKGNTGSLEQSGKFDTIPGLAPLSPSSIYTNLQ